MAQSAEEWSKVAFYENVADNENAVPELRMLSVRKANWLRILARLQAAGLQAPAQIQDREALLFSPTRLAAARTINDVTGYPKRLSVTSSHRVGRLFRSQLRSTRALG